MKKVIVTYNMGEVIENGQQLDSGRATSVFEGSSVEVSDGYHTMDELYDHRIALYIAFCREYASNNWHPEVWRSKKHHPASEAMYEGWFVLGIKTATGKQVSYHLPLARWDECDFAEDLEFAPEWDGHTPADVLERLKNYTTLWI